MLGYFGFIVMMFLLIMVISFILAMIVDNLIFFVIGAVVYIFVVISSSTQGVTYRCFVDPDEFYRYMKTYMTDVLTASDLVSNSGKPITYVFTKKNRSIRHDFVIAKLVDEQDENFANQLYDLAFINVKHIPNNVKLTSNIKYIYNDKNIVTDAVITVNILPKE